MDPREQRGRKPPGHRRGSFQPRPLPGRTYYDALGRNDLAYLLARAVQFFLPGIPQVYYVGLLAGHNDTALLSSTGVRRDINRQRFVVGEAELPLERPIVRELLRLIGLRKDFPAFGGCFRSLPVSRRALSLEWTYGECSARLTVDFRNLAYAVDLIADGVPQQFRFDLAAAQRAPEVNAAAAI